MLSELPVEEREQVMRDSCDQIVEKSYTRRYTPAQVDEKRAALADVHIQLSEYQAELDGVKAEFRGKMKPLMEQAHQLVSNLKAGGEFVTTDCFKFVDQEEGKVGYYDPQGHLLEQRPINPDERQRTIFQATRMQAAQKQSESEKQVAQCS